MGVIIDSAIFTYGAAPTTYYRADAGDLVTATLRIRSQMRVSSLNNTITLDPSTNQLTSPSVSWIDEGFRVGDWVLFYIRSYPSGSVISGPYWTQIQSVTDFVCDVTSMPVWYDFAANEYIEFYVVESSGSYQQVERSEVDVLLNHCISSQTGTPNSLIDGEVTRVRFSDIETLPIPTNIAGQILGFQSGQFLLDATLTKVVSTDPSFFMYDLELVFVNSGIYDTDGSWHFSSECLKAYVSTQWARVAGEPYARTISNYDLAGDSGYFNEPFNTGVNNSTLVDGTTGIDYCNPTLHSVIVDGPITDVMIGAAYLPTDTTYYKNKLQPQQELTMIIPSTPITLGVLPSFTNPVGAAYTIDITNISVVGSQTQIDFTFTPNTQFGDFMDTRDEDDRLFYVWVKCGNINHLVYSAQLECAPIPAGPLLMEKSVSFLDHSQNVTTYASSYVDNECNTEDDIAYYGEFLLDKGVIYEKFNVYVEAKNATTGEDFALRVIQFNFDGVLVSGDGRYLLNESLSINPTLPTTSVKRDSLLQLVPTLDTTIQYGVSIYAPYLMDWRYWIPFPAASTDFWPNQNKNWVQYEGGDWSVQLRLELVKDGLGYIHQEEIIILDYDSSPSLTNQIELYEDASNLNVPIVLEGQLHRVVSLHTLASPLVWNTTNIWGQITVEPSQSNPRWICSSVVPFDNNSLNPLTPLSGTLINITFPSPNVARMECYFNPELINLQNGVKFTGKIKGCTAEGEINKTTSPDDVQKTTTDNIDKTIA